MTVFKAYFKILMRNIGLIVMYLVIAIVVVNLNAVNAPAPSSYEDIQITLGVIDRDDTEFSHHFH